MMPADSDGTKLDLSKLTDEEARHVWQVIQRDFNLRKKEEDRLGDLKSKIVREDTKRELLGYQSTISDAVCIHCLHPFKFLLNNKRQCLDCKVFVCKACSSFSKKEDGWVCDPCQMARVLKIGTLEWFHENVRARFRRFGSAKVMRSLYKRLNKMQSCSQTDLRDDLEDDTHSMPDIYIDSLCRQEDELSEGSRGQHYRLVTELNMRMSTIEILLSHLENKIVTSQSLDLVKLTDPEEELLSPVDIEELKLKKKLEELTKNISDKGFSSDEDETNKMTDDINPTGREASSFTPAISGKTAKTAEINFFKNEVSSDVQKTTANAERSFNTNWKLSSYEVSTVVCSELSQLEGKVAMAAARVQSTQSGVSEIQNKIAALSATGTKVENHHNKESLASKRRMSYDVPTKPGNGSRVLRKLSIM